MKKSMIWMALFALVSVGAAHAATPTAATPTAATPNDTVRYDLTCSFARPGYDCTALSRIFLSRLQSNTASPNWFGNLLSVACNPVVPGAVPSLISASDATLYRYTGSSVRWRIFNSDSTVAVGLTDRPFSDHPKTVTARLEITGHHHIDGSCTVTPHTH